MPHKRTARRIRLVSMRAVNHTTAEEYHIPWLGLRWNLGVFVRHARQGVERFVGIAGVGDGLDVGQLEIAVAGHTVRVRIDRFVLRADTKPHAAVLLCRRRERQPRAT